MYMIGLLLCATSLASAADATEKPITTEDRSHWAFQPIVRPKLPTLKSSPETKHPIDLFIRQPLDEAGLKPSKQAEKTTLIRRLNFDLTGLPPSPEEIQAFLDDRGPEAYKRVVDRLLASPRYGERWAQHWLDLARYADTDGYEFDQIRPNAWRYRDWVVAAMNRDLPYDQFVRLQIAGDEVAPDDPSAFIATGFNRCYPDMVDLNDQGLRRQNALNDITETTGLVFLGLTIGCARCHDHKFDPIRQSDFYRLQAFFTPARFRDDYLIAAPVERKAFERRREEWQALIIDLQSQLIELEAPVRAALKPTSFGLTDDVIVALQKPASQRTPREISAIYEAQSRDRRVTDPGLRIVLGVPGTTIRASLLRAIASIQKAAPKPLPQAIGLDEMGPLAPPTYLLKRGDFASKGAVVDPGFPSVLIDKTDGPPIKSLKQSTGRRSALATWLVDPSNPLTARVMVNRLWQSHFGRGLVDSPNDFGTQGSPPTHPDLLDWLAAEFIERGWSFKSMHRLIVTSATYCQDSRPSASALKVDPSNDLLWRQTQRRLDGEAIRDSLLAVSNNLNFAMTGPCVFPELPAELMKLSSKGSIWPVSTRREDRNRRSLYVFTRRNLRYPFFEVFDRPDTNASCPRRPTSTIAPQALTLLNGTLSNDQAKALAARVQSKAKDQWIDLAYRLTLGRSPNSEEIQLAETFLKDSSFDDFCLALLNLNEFIYID